MEDVSRLAIFKKYQQNTFLNQADIIVRLKNGDPYVFSDIVNLWQDMVYNTALGIVQNAEDAEDITQEVFLKVHESVSGFREESTLSTWIYKITISKALDLEKKRKAQKRGGFLKRVFDSSPAEEPLSFDHPGVALDNKENAKVLFAAINKLPEKQKIAFLLQRSEGLGNEAIAAIMDTTTTAVESLQGRAKTNLRSTLQDYYENHFK